MATVPAHNIRKQKLVSNKGSATTKLWSSAGGRHDRSWQKTAEYHTKVSTHPSPEAIPSRSGTYNCVRETVTNKEKKIFNWGNFRSSLVIKTDTDITLYGITIPSQLKNEKLISKKDNKTFSILNTPIYGENIIFKLAEIVIGLNNILEPMLEFKFEDNAVAYNENIVMKLPNPVRLKHDKMYYIEIQLKKRGYYPLANRVSHLRYGRVDFDFSRPKNGPVIGSPTKKHDGFIESIIFHDKNSNTKNHKNIKTSNNCCSQYFCT